ncbi:MAG: DNA translocase FtsK 4TM domain-containing protein [Parcubacteria group bacterium]|nr:DNA translocase FtsK 4TM domain-containing protein [Parcubacteria group bacterium]
MAKKKFENGKEKEEKKDSVPFLKDETRSVAWGIVFFVLAIFFIFAPNALAGVAGTFIYDVLEKLLGFGFFLLPLLFILLGISFMREAKSEVEQKLAVRTGIGSFVFVLSGLGILALLPGGEAGGLLGKAVSYPLLTFFGSYFSPIFLIALIVISLIFLFDTAPKKEHFSFFSQALALVKKLFSKKTPEEADAMPEQTMLAESETPKTAPQREEQISQKSDDGEEVEKEKRGLFGVVKKKSEEEIFDEKISHAKEALFLKDFVPPPISLLEKDRGKPGSGDVKGNLNIIKRTLQQFGINVEMDEVSIGPSVTRYALKPAEGVKLSRIVGLQNELALNLAAHPVRIEAPIPGTSLVGIEVPNSAKTTVGLASTLSAQEFTDSSLPLLVSLGKSISGKSHFGNVAKMPHLLVAGATGSGKSVMVHTMITSLLYRNPPENLRLIMIDPKRVELTLYNGIPHLLTPVITDAKKTIQTLRWAAKEMDRRYDVLETEKVRDIQSYHKNVFGEYAKKAAKEPRAILEGGEEEEIAPDAPERMPYIVIIIDELADIMQTYPRELEASIVRLAQMSRAVGIHLILSTQRPSVNVITGLIKANIPSRIALQVSSQIDSRTILDTGGAEKLLGAGDMLYLSGEMSKPLRMQSAFVSEAEVKKVVKYLVDEYSGMAPQEINLTDIPDKNAIFSTSLEDDGADDDLYEQAREEVISAGKASTSYLQRKLRIGYARAARIMDILEEKGVIGPGDGAKQREVLIKNESTIGQDNSEPDM